MFFQVAEIGEANAVKTQVVRNAFVEIPASEDTEEILIRNKWDYIKDGDKFYIPGEDSIRVAKMFPNKVELRRPLADGVLNKGEDKKLLVLDQIISKTVGKAPDDKSVVCTCISSPPVDGSSDSEFHKRRLEALFKNKGWNVKIIEEGHAVVLAERPTVVESDGSESPYSGIGVSFGAGRVNCVLTYKGIQVIGMSASKSGDFIDKKVAEETGTPLAHITGLKETRLDFTKIDELSNDPKEGDRFFALDCRYRQVIREVFSMFGEQFKKVSSQFDAPLDIVIAGGTSMPKGFVGIVDEEVKGMELPFQIKTVRHAKDPRNAVVEGCLAYAVAAQKKLEKGSS
jgi:hypothetical protein